MVSTHGTHFSPPGLRTEPIPSKLDELGTHRGTQCGVQKRDRHSPSTRERSKGRHVNRVLQLPKAGQFRVFIGRGWHVWPEGTWPVVRSPPGFMRSQVGAPRLPGQAGPRGTQGRSEEYSRVSIDPET